MNIPRCLGSIYLPLERRSNSQNADSSLGITLKCGAAHTKQPSMWKIATPGASSAELGMSWWGRIKTLWQLKLSLTIVVNLGFWALYLFLSRHALLPIHTLPMTWLDKWAGFRPHPWAWVYESNFILGAIIPWLITSRQQLRQYAIGFATLSAASFLIFAFFPVASPRPTNAESSPFLIFITHVDGPLNAFPSLHAGCLVYGLCWARRLFAQHMNLLTVAFLLVWAGSILFA